MYTELVGNFEATTKSDFQAINLNSSAVMRAEALGLINNPTASSAVDVYACSCCGSGCNCSASGTWGCNKPSSGMPAAETIMVAALAA